MKLIYLHMKYGYRYLIRVENSFPFTGKWQGEFLTKLFLRKPPSTNLCLLGAGSRNMQGCMPLELVLGY